MTPKKLWQPSERAIEEAQVTQFARQVIRKRKLDANSYAEFYRLDGRATRRSSGPRSGTACGVIASRKGATVLVDGDKMPGAHWFPEARLNFAENLMRRGDRGDAFVLWDETRLPAARRRYSDLTSDVSRAAQALQRARPARRRPRRGLHPEHARGRHARARRAVAGHRLVVLLARLRRRRRARALRPDRAQGAVLRRRLPLQRRGARFARARARDRRRSCRRCARSWWCRTSTRRSTSPTSRRRCARTSGCAATPPATIEFAQLPFDHPVFILFTSGTTGKPKCIVHGAGGTLLQALKTYKLQLDLRPGDRYFYFCTTNWVVWNLLFTALAAEATRDALRRLAVRARTRTILFDYAREGAHHPLRHLGRSSSTRWRSAAWRRWIRTTCRGAAHDHLDRLAARAGELRLRLRDDQEGRLPRLDLRRHRHHGRLRRRAARCCRSIAASCSAGRSAWRSRCSMRREMP